MKNQQLLDWLKSEQHKDSKEIEAYKQKILRDLKSLKREDLVPKPKKITLKNRSYLLALELEVRMILPNVCRKSTMQMLFILTICRMRAGYYPPFT